VHDTAVERSDDGLDLGALLARVRRRWLAQVALAVAVRASIGLTIVSCILIGLDRSAVLGDTAVLSAAAAAVVAAIAVLVAATGLVVVGEATHDRERDQRGDDPGDRLS
jgi:hypothetical protein